ncbi:flavin-binding monooxygenase [Trichoderma cornu-damae]|uniref:Flavin-binding monooxygenase n=1 Tax=Trichoderma cornu-damae TaxID=654480 RepID=A0A9P8QI33_9HYPO|nr:flavin-binding monooxygenase [Trichoderma cornu-damae]
MEESSANRVRDVIIVGAGISGISAAHHLQRALPNSDYLLLEGRDRVGGTWDLFRYPGIRSDTDLHTFGFGWEPWQENRAIADGDSIARYLRTTAEKDGIYGHIRFQHRINAANWSSASQLWTLDVENNSRRFELQTKFLILGTGYYDYHEPLKAEIPGLSSNFRGTIVHPQFWPKDLDYAGKRVVIIGSGATAITLLPNLAKKARHVTMLQRSPTYIMSIDNATGGSWIHKLLPRSWAFQLDRVMFMWMIIILYNFCRYFPERSRAALEGAVAKQLPKGVPMDPHFRPLYKPWDQRVCFSPNGDFFESLREGRAHVETGHIKTVTEDSIVLETGKTLQADVIVTATGLKFRIGGNIRVSVDDEEISLADRYAWKATLLQDVPNLAFMLGYVNASWTLGVETSSQIICRLLQHMRRKNYSSVVPRLPQGLPIQPRPIWDLDATYVKKAQGFIPRCGNVGPWRGRTNYFVDLLRARYGSITKDLVFRAMKP